MNSFRRRTFDRAFALVCIACYAVGVAFRYRFICVLNRPTDPENFLGDATWYVHATINGFRDDYVPTMYDTLFPPGAPMYFALLRWIDPSLRLIDYTQWILSCLVPLILGYTAYRLFGKRNGWFVFTFASLYFPLWEYFGYFISEGPFIITLTGSLLLLVLSLQSKTVKGAVLWAVPAGLVLGACAVCKSCALFTAALVALALVVTRLKTSFRLWPTLVTAALTMTVVIIPVSIRATRLNEGRFLLIANDAPRTFLLGHQGRVGLTWWVDEKRNFQMNFSYPPASQHQYAEVRTYPFGVYETAPNYAAGWQWIKANPIEALLLSIEHVFDLFATALPWPGYFRWYVGWTIFFNNVFISLIFVPALYHVIRSHRALLVGDWRYAGDLAVAAATVSIYLLAFFFVGEGRYRICYDGFMMMLAGRAFFPPRPDEAFAFD